MLINKKVLRSTTIRANIIPITVPKLIIKDKTKYKSIITGFVTKVAWRVPHVEHLCSPRFLFGFISFYVMFCPFSFGHFVMSILPFPVSDYTSIVGTSS